MMTDEEFNAFVERANAELAQKQEALSATFELGRHAAFSLDQATATLSFMDAQGNVEVTAAMTPIGSFSSKSNSWQWSWANKSYLEPLRQKAARLKELHEITGINVFDMPAFEADAQMAWELTAMAVSHLGAAGAYRIPVAASQLEVFVAINAISALDAK